MAFKMAQTVMRRLFPKEVKTADASLLSIGVDFWTIDKEGWRYKYYEKGVVEVGPVDPNNAPTALNLDIGTERE